MYFVQEKKASLSQGAQVPHRAGRFQHGRRGAHTYHEGGWVAGLWIRIDLMRIWIRIQHFFATADPDPDPSASPDLIQFQIQGFDDQIWENLQLEFTL
jgi:hypothetical protein